MTSNDFGARVLQARLNLAAKRGRPVSQVEVARALDVTGVTVGRWESGEKEPSLRTIVRLAQVLEVDPGWLAFGDGPTFPNLQASISGTVTDAPTNGVAKRVGEIPAESYEDRGTAAQNAEKRAAAKKRGKRA